MAAGIKRHCRYQAVKGAADRLYEMRIWALYYTFNPVNPAVVKIWKGLEEKHKTFHTYGTQMISAVRLDSDIGQQQLKPIYDKAQACSKDLISDFQNLIQVIEALSKEHVRIFE